MTTHVEQHVTRTDSALSQLGQRSYDQHGTNSPGVPTQQRAAPRVPRQHVRGLRVAGLRINVTYPRRDVVLIALAGELDLSTVDRVRNILAPRLESAVDNVVLDLSQLNFLAVAGLGLLRGTRARAVANNIDLRLVTVTREVTRPLRMTGLDRVFACYADVATALNQAGD